VGSILAATSVLASTTPGMQGLTIGIPLVAGLAMGTINGLLIAYMRLPPFIVTLGSMTALRGAAYLFANGTTIINVLGGTSLVGGIGSVAGTLIVALIIAFLNNGLTLMNISYFWQLVIKGLVIIIAVMIDKLRTTRR